MVKTTRAQRVKLFQKWNLISDQCTYRQFRARVQDVIGDDGAIIVPWCGMWLGIEPDGYTHT